MTLETRCCIAGGGPAGMMLGVLLARAGIPVVVLEKHADFLRDFRGDTVHPSTLELMHELGVLNEFLERPHAEVRQVRGKVGDELVTLADFSHLPVHAPFIAMVPQWDFLDFLATKGRHYHPAFRLLMRAEVFELIERDHRIVGVRAETPSGVMDIHADLVVPPTAGRPRCAISRACAWTISARRSTSSGCGCRSGLKMTRPPRSATSATATYS